MSYFDLILIFIAIPLLVVVYQIMPKKIRPILLLLASYGFFFYVSKWRIIFLIISSLSILDISGPLKDTPLFSIAETKSSYRSISIKKLR